jgi:pyruvate,water dikinase
MVEKRKAEFEQFEKTPAPPDRLVTLGPVGFSLPNPQWLACYSLDDNTPFDPTQPNILKGTPCSPGIVEGVVRVVRDLKEARGLNGEILVTEKTDPGWVPLYPSCSGLLIERGSLLSHSAVVARELGLPTIVGISGGLMQKLQTGMRVKMDAAKGIVEILMDKAQLQ